MQSPVQHTTAKSPATKMNLTKSPKAFLRRVPALLIADMRRDPHFIVAERGGPLLQQYVHCVFWPLSREIGLRRPGDRTGEGHDLRHRFAIRTQVSWQRQCRSVDPHGQVEGRNGTENALKPSSSPQTRMLSGWSDKTTVL